MMNQDGANLEKRKNQLKKVSCLLIDDMGLENATAWVVSNFSDILSYRLDNNLPCFFTSNLTKYDYGINLANGKDVDRVQAGRFYKRTLEPIATEISMSGQNRRLDT